MFEHLANPMERANLARVMFKFQMALVAAKVTFFLMAGFALLIWAF